MIKAIITNEVLQEISNSVKENWNPTVDEIIELVVRKNHDYGDAWQQFGIFTPLVRLNDKILRVEKLSNSEALVAGENIVDTLRDMVGYSLLALEYLRLNPGASFSDPVKESMELSQIGTDNAIVEERMAQLFPEQKLEIISKIVDNDDEDDSEEDEDEE